VEPDILKAIPRQKVIKRYVLLMLLGGAGAFLAQSQLFPWIKGYLSVSDATEALRRLKLVMLGIGASILPVSAYLALLARRSSSLNNSLPPAHKCGGIRPSSGAARPCGGAGSSRYARC
jgi:hypothetical protein